MNDEKPKPLFAQFDASADTDVLVVLMHLRNGLLHDKLVALRAVHVPSRARGTLLALDTTAPRDTSGQMRLEFLAFLPIEGLRKSEHLQAYEIYDHQGDQITLFDAVTDDEVPRVN